MWVKMLFNIWMDDEPRIHLQKVIHSLYKEPSFVGNRRHKLYTSLELYRMAIQGFQRGLHEFPFFVPPGKSFPDTPQ